MDVNISFENPNVDFQIDDLFTLEITAVPGAKGDQGDPATDEQVQTAVDNYLDEHLEIVVEDGSITTAKLADGAVTNVKIADGTITGNKFVPALPITEIKATTTGGKYPQGKTTKLGVSNTFNLVESSHFENALGAVTFSTNTAYAVGDYVEYNKKTYKCINAHSGTWADADFEETKILPRLDDVEESVTQLNSELTAITDGTTAVGTAEQLLSNKYVENTEPYLFRATPADATREFDTIVGGSVAFNQYINPTFSTKTINGLTVTNNGDGSITIDGTADASGYVSITNAFALTTNHIYYVRGYKKIGTNGGSFNLGDAWADTGDGRMEKNTQGYTSSSLRFSYVSGDSFSNTKMYPQFSNLTQMFGSTIADYVYSLEYATTGAGVAWFKKLFPKDYYEYNAGELLSVEGLVSHDMVGFNQWDGTSSEQNKYLKSDGTTAASNTWNVTDYIRVIPNATYHFENLNSAESLACICWYNANKELISSKNIRKSFNSTAPSNASYVRAAYDRNLANDICINLSWSGYRDGEYEAYKSWSYPLDSSLTLRGIPKLDSSNNLYYDGDIYKSDGTVTRNTILRAYQSGDESLANAITDGTNTVVYSANVSTESATPYTEMQICDGYGTEEFVTDSVVPVGHSTRYPVNQVSKLDGLPSDFSTLIAPTEKTYKATRNYTTGSLLIVDNVLYKATANIANGGTLTPNTNILATTLSEVIASLA